MGYSKAIRIRLKRGYYGSLIGYLLLLSTYCIAQAPATEFADSVTKAHAYHPTSRNILLHGSLYTGTLLLLNEAWYKDQPHAPLHSFNDSKEWLQIDKAGHAWTAYQLGRAAMRTWKTHGDAALAGTLAGWGFMTIIETLDARSAVWGWSWSDIGANTLGSGLFYIQQKAWKEQRIQLKFSFHTNHYQDPTLHDRARSLYGNSLAERILKDYNGQTYWLSINPASFSHDTRFPSWFNIALGYGGSGLWGGFENRKRDSNGNVIFDRTDIPRVREYYLSPDIDLTKIHSRKKWVRELLWCLNAIKIPAPTLMLDQRGRVRFYPIYF